MLDFKSSITYYLNNQNWKKSLLVHGRWGIGKTFHMKNFFKDLKKENLPNYTHYCFVNGYEINKDFDIKKYICNNSYLIGTNQLDPLVNDFISKIRKNYEKLPTFVKSTISGLEKGFKLTTKAKSGIEIEINTVLSKFFDSHMEYIYQSSKIKECIVIIDELDRNTTTDITVIFSKIIDLIENFNVKVILITNMEMTSNIKDFQLWSEKVIDLKVEFKNTENPIEPPYGFSEDFIWYFDANKEYFFNYRSYERYLNFEKIVDDKYSQYCDNPFNKSCIRMYKEIIFYAIFMTENSDYFQSQKDFKESKEAIGVAPYRHYPEMRDVLDFISLNPSMLFSRLNDDLFNSNLNKSIKFRLEAEEYLKSKKVCHAKEKYMSIQSPDKFIVNIIKNYSDLMEITPRTALSKEILGFDKPSYKWNEADDDYLTLLFWLNELKIYADKEIDIFNFFSSTIESIFDDYWFLTIPNDFLSELILKQDIDILIKPFEELYKDHSYLIPLFKTEFSRIKNFFHESIINNIIVYSCPFKLNYLISHTEDFIQKLLLESDDFYEDLTKIKKTIPKKYKKLISEYLKKYPNDDDRLLKNYLLKTI